MPAAGFEACMRGWLGPEWTALRDALEGRPVRAVRLHRVGPDPAGRLAGGGALAIGSRTLSVPGDLAAQLGEAVPWWPAGRYVSADSPVGRHVYHEAGAYYVQEPSAMAATAALAAQPGERVLDLCAAPGGKAAALGWALGGRGQLVANEVHPGRARVLAQNLERLGVPALVVQEAPARLAQRWEGRFDAVLVDAPCSGEGLFRREAAARAQWTEAGVAGCAARQREILASAVRLARPGGRVVYSTCTFNPVENEQVIAWALRALAVEAAELPLWPEWDQGRPEWCGGMAALERARRLWPHRGRGEGHFVAALTVAGAAGAGGPCTGPTHGIGTAAARGGPSGGAATAEWSAWLGRLAADVPEAWERPLAWGQRLFSDESGGLPLNGLRVLRPGLCLAEGAGAALRPHHQLAMAARLGAMRRARELDLEAARAYLGGAPLPGGAGRGLVWLHTGGLPLGWARDAGQRANNLYPQALRRTDLIARW
jgi:16S rRNA C967 or C1407 C5-methylase (RsmB/RsmF family)/NOL1/NOP2/fmu family ribosome biogenesis protein